MLDFHCKDLTVVPLAPARASVKLWPPARKRRTRPPPEVALQDGAMASDEECEGPQGPSEASDVEASSSSSSSSDDEGYVDEVDGLELFGDQAFDELSGSSSSSSGDDAEAVPAPSPAPADELPGNSSSGEDGEAVSAPGNLAGPAGALGPDAVDPEPGEVQPGPGADALAAVRAKAAAMVVLPSGGFIAFYESTGSFQATCVHHDDATSACRLTRTANAAKNLNGARAGQGRPLGFLVGWVEGHGIASTSGDHKSPVALAAFAAKDVRMHNRELLRGCAGAQALMAFERPQREGEGVEPEIAP